MPQAEVLLAESSAAMRSMSRIQAQAEASVLVVTGSGYLTLALPDGVDGRWDGFGYSVRTVGTQGSAAVLVNGKQTGYLASKGAATVARDTMLGLPTYVSNWRAQKAGGDYELEGTLHSDKVRAITSALGVSLPGDPEGRLVLSLDSGSKAWRSLKLKLVWVAARFEVFGREIEAGPAGTAIVTFSSDAQ